MSLADSSKEAEQNVSSLNQSMKELSQSKASGKDYYEAFKKAAERDVRIFSSNSNELAEQQGPSAI